MKRSAAPGRRLAGATLLPAHTKALTDTRRLIDEATGRARANTADIQLDNVRSLVDETAAAPKTYERLRKGLDEADDDVLKCISPALPALGDFARTADRSR